MKKVIVLLVAILMISVSTTAVIAGNGNGAIVVRIDDICQMDITTEDTGEQYFASGDIHYVETPNGLWNLTCHGDVYDQTAPLGKAYTERSTPDSPTIACYTPWDVTYDARVTITPSGKIQLVCQGDLTP